MPNLDLAVLGNRIRDARKECGLTQQELANQTGLAVKTIQDIEKGRKNPTYETLACLLARLGMSPNTIFLSKKPVPAEEVEHLFANFQLCDIKTHKILIKTLRFLAEQLLLLQDETG